MPRSYPSRPIIGVGAVILDEGRVVLVKRGAEPLKGRWSLPGGALELGETLLEGLRREVGEETGLEVRVVELVEVFERITEDAEGRVRYHYVLIDYLCQPIGGVLRAGDDAAEAVWVERSRLDEYDTTEGAVAVIEKAFQMRDRVSDAHKGDR